MTNKFFFSSRSIEKINTLNKDLKKLVLATMAKQIFDFGIIEGYRNKEKQDKLFADGLSKLQFPNSKHNTKPSLAFDFAIFHEGIINFDDKGSYYMAVGIFKAVAQDLGLKIRCGADWDSDFKTSDQTFHDLGHIELIS